jgi:8-oxo-dGTP pyrophosphatase MutT (NUDIX family)
MEQVGMMETDENVNPWTTVGARTVYENSWIKVREDAVIRPDGAPGIYGVVNFQNIAVGVLAVAGELIYLVGQYRYPIQRYSWEIPEGGCPKSERPLAAAKRELQEETGLVARTWKFMGKSYLSNSVSDELAIWFLAEDLSQGPNSPEETEKLVIKTVSVDDAVRMVNEGEITDAISIMAILQYALAGRSGLQFSEAF